ncbi:MAG: hypothetical protein NWP98_10570 [Erythrobacter sp.]|nr:hypothetical protein [Erythrobacter sp.]
MAMPALVLQTAGSLVAILALAGLAWWLRLGRAPLLNDDDAVRRAASEVEDGFAPVTIAHDAEGRAALTRDARGRIMVIKRHGNRFAGRLLTNAAQARLWNDRGQTTLAVDCGEARFGTVFLDLLDPDAWAAAINALNAGYDA